MRSSPSNHFQNEVIAQLVVHFVGYVDAAVGHDAVGDDIGGDAFHAVFGRFERPNAVQGEEEVFFLLEADDFAAVAGFGSLHQLHVEFAFWRGFTDEYGVALAIVGKAQLGFGGVDDDFFALHVFFGGIGCCKAVQPCQQRYAEDDSFQHGFLLSADAVGCFGRNLTDDDLRFGRRLWGNFLYGRADGIFREDGFPMEAAGVFVFVEQDFVLAGGNAFYVGADIGIGGHAGGAEVEEVVPFAHAEHTFIVVRTTEDFVDVVFAQTRFHLFEFIGGRECALVFVEGYGVGFGKDGVIRRSVGFNVAFAGAGGQYGCGSEVKGGFGDAGRFHG